MSRRGVIFDGNSADRIAKVVTEAERNRAGASGRMRGVQPNEKQVVEVISQHDATPMYLGQAKVFVAKYRQYEDHEQCFIMEASRDDLVVGRRYPARRVGDYGGRPLYLTHCCGEDPAPPDPECDYCEGETPAAWDLTLEDFSGDCSSLNGQYQLDWTEDGCGWAYETEGLEILLEATASEYGLTITDGDDPPGLEIVYRRERTNAKCCGPVGMDLDSSTCEGAPESQQVLAPACQQEPSPDHCWCYDDPDQGVSSADILLFDDLPDTLYLWVCGYIGVRWAPECFDSWHGLVELTKTTEGACGWRGTKGNPTPGQCGLDVTVFLLPQGCFYITGWAYSPPKPLQPGETNPLIGGHPNMVAVYRGPTNPSGTLQTEPLVVHWAPGSTDTGATFSLYEDPPESVNCCPDCDGEEQLHSWIIDPELEGMICGTSPAGWELAWWSAVPFCTWGFDGVYSGVYGSATVRIEGGYLIAAIQAPGFGPVQYISDDPVSVCCGEGSVALSLDSDSCGAGTPPATLTLYRGNCVGDEPPPDPIGDPCEECTEGDTPSAWSLILADLTGDCTILNDVHTLVQDDDCEWKASSSGFSFTLENNTTKTILTITDGDANVGVWEGVTTEDCCEPIELTQESGSGCLDGVGTLVLVPSCYVPPICEWCTSFGSTTAWQLSTFAGFTGENCAAFQGSGSLGPVLLRTSSCLWTHDLGSGYTLRLEAFEGSLTLDGFDGDTLVFSYSELSWDGNCFGEHTLNLAFSMCDEEPASITITSF